MSEKDGGAAFPEVETDIVYQQGQDYPRTYSSGGMSLRDYFAAQAIAAQADTFSLDSDRAMTIAARAYALADAMLKERAK